MASMEIYIESSGGNEHCLEVDFDYTVGNDGIGSYEYWGTKEYDEGRDYIEEVIINSIKIVRDEICRNADYSFKLDSKGNKIFHKKYREIDLNKLSCIDISEIEDKISEDYDFEKDCEDDEDDEDDECDYYDCRECEWDEFN